MIYIDQLLETMKNIEVLLSKTIHNFGKLSHNDLHTGNIMIRNYLDINSCSVQIIDWGMASFEQKIKTHAGIKIKYYQSAVYDIYYKYTSKENHTAAFDLYSLLRFSYEDLNKRTENITSDIVHAQNYILSTLQLFTNTFNATKNLYII